MIEAAKMVIARMAMERGITADEMRRLIQETIHSSSDLTLRREMRSRFGKRELTAEEFIEEIGKMIETAHLVE